MPRCQKLAVIFSMILSQLGLEDESIFPFFRKVSLEIKMYPKEQAHSTNISPINLV